MTIGEKIESIMIDSNLNVSQFANKIGYSRQYVYTLINGKDSRGCESKPQIDTLKQICIRSHYDFRTFLEETGYIELAEETQKAQPTTAKPILSDESELMLEKFNSLNKIQKIAIMNLMDTFIEPQKATIKNNA